MSTSEPPPLAVAWRSVRNASTLLVVGGMIAAVAGWRPGAWIAVGSLSVGAAALVLIAAVAFRRTMRRSWPDVEPVPDDDEWA